MNQTKFMEFVNMVKEMGNYTRGYWVKKYTTNQGELIFVKNSLSNF